MLVRVMPGPSGNEAKSSHLLPLAQAVGQMVFPIKPAAHHQTTIRAAVDRRRDDDIGYLVILPAGHRQEVVALLEPTQSGVRFLSADLPAIERVAEVFHVYPAAASPLLGAQLDKFQYLADGKFANHCLFSFSIYASSSSPSRLKLVVLLSSKKSTSS